MTIEQLKYFVTAAECLNFTEAANREYVSQPTLSYGISSLENQLQLKLFTREKKGISLTRAGAMFYGLVKDYLWGIENAVKTVQELERNALRTLSVGFLITPGTKFIHQWLPRFLKENPDTKLNLEQYELSELKEALFNNSVDVALSRSLDFMDCADLVERQPVMHDKLIVAVSKDHPFAARDSVSVKDLDGETIILPDAKRSKGWYNFVVEACRAHGAVMDESNIMTVQSASAIYPMVSCNLGIGLSPTLWKETYGDNVKYLTISDGDICFDSAIVWRKSNKNPLIEKFVENARRISCCR